MRHVLVALTVTLGACAANLSVTSQPPGARVLIDGKDSGQVTPATIAGKQLRGEHKVGVALDGYATPDEQSARAGVAISNIVWSVLLPVPVLFVNIVRGYANAEPNELHFELQPATASAAVPGA